MKPIRSFLIVFLLSLIACSRDNNVELEGTWVMTHAFDKNSNQFLVHPPVAEDVEITFTNQKYFGHTIVNAFGDGDFELQGDDIWFRNHITTLVLEDEWGGAFMHVLNTCNLVTVAPCTPSTIEINGDIMTIDSPLQYKLTFKRK